VREPPRNRGFSFYPLSLYGIHKRGVKRLGKYFLKAVVVKSKELTRVVRKRKEMYNEQDDIELEMLKRKRASKREVIKKRDPFYNSNDSMNSRVRRRVTKKKKRHK
jgi:hypothetical protein